MTEANTAKYWKREANLKECTILGLRAEVEMMEDQLSQVKAMYDAEGARVAELETEITKRDRIPTLDDCIHMDRLEAVNKAQGDTIRRYKTALENIHSKLSMTKVPSQNWVKTLHGELFVIAQFELEIKELETHRREDVALMETTNGTMRLAEELIRLHRAWQVEVIEKLGIPASDKPHEDHARIIEAIDNI